MKSPAGNAGPHSESDGDDGPTSTSPAAESASDVSVSDGHAVEADPDEAAAQAGGGDDVETVVDDEPVDDEPVDPQQRSRTKGRSAMRWIAAVVLVAVLAVAGVEGWQLYQHHQRDVAAEQALEAAKKFTLTLTTIDPNAVGTNITDVLDGSTGEFKNLYQQSSAQLRQVLVDNKATANGMVVEAAVKSATKDKVEVVLFVDQAVSNATSPEPQLDRSRVVMTMEKVDGRWLASKVDLP
ncbi:hypothetical protein NGTWS1803_09590 [Mycolicibacterium cyprinidarum]|nr:hypothetical protein NGTWS1803_09590 [Mycolicibacterium sp. NGTWS1803]